MLNARAAARFVALAAVHREPLDADAIVAGAFIDRAQGRANGDFVASACERTLLKDLA